MHTTGAVLLAHGYAEHSGRYAHLAEFLVKRGYGVYGIDHYGHGRSEGGRADVPRFELFMEDLQALRQSVSDKLEKLPVFVLGHSMGAAVALLFALRYGEGLSGIITSGAALRPGANVAASLKKISGMIAAVAPAYPVVVFDSEGVSRDPEVVRLYHTDPLNYHGKVRARMGRELLRVEKLLNGKALEKISLPILILHGGDDRLVNPDCSRILHAAAASSDKELKIFDGLYHEIFNEPEQEGIYKIMTEWLDKHIPG